MLRSGDLSKPEIRADLVDLDEGELPALTLNITDRANRRSASRA